MARGKPKVNPFTMVVVVWLLALIGQNAVIRRGPATLKTWGNLRSLAQSASLSVTIGRQVTPVPSVRLPGMSAAVATTFPASPAFRVTARVTLPDTPSCTSGGLHSPCSRAPPRQTV